MIRGDRPVALTRAELEKIWTGRLLLMTKRATFGRKLRQIRHRLVHSGDPQIQAHPGRSADRLLRAAALRAGDAALLPGDHRQGAGASRAHHPRRAGDRACRDLAFRSSAGRDAHLYLRHTTNRVDVELGAKLFRHLLALPLSYFQARRVGDSVARVQGAGEHPGFLTGNALTLVIDLVFTSVFLAVMWLLQPDR